ncbi:MAG: hypothetical protein QOI48_3079 [Solirubrobacteraceae bacterium]|jgi:hypothetical protein|nr:hypothetical protein [Solirubrobacteraceae bacterium]
MEAMAETSTNEIWIIGVREGSLDRGPWLRKTVERDKVTVEELSARLGGFVAGMHAVISKIQATSREFPLVEVQVAVEIGAKGSVSLLGTGGEASTSGGMTLTFRRPQLEKAAAETD